MGHLVDKERDDERGDDDKYPAHTAQHVGLFIAKAASSFVDVGHEESHDRCHEVPRQVDTCQKGYRFHCYPIGKEHLYVVNDATFFSLLCRILSTFVELPLQCPCDEGHDE